MTSILDINLITVYKKMVGLLGIQVSDIDTSISNNVTATGFLNVSNTSIFFNDISMYSSLNVSSSSIFFGNNTILSTLNVSGIAYLNNTIIKSTLNVSGNSNINNLFVTQNSIINNYVSVNTNLNVLGNGYVNNNTIVQNIYSLNNNNLLNISAPIINIGNLTSQVFINGTVNYIATTNLEIVDKIISLNLNETTLNGNDLGNFAGINILGISSLGYLRTNIDATKFEIQPPLGDYGIILTQDLNNNLYISNTSLLNNNVTMLSNLNVNGNTFFNNSVTIQSNLNVVNNIIFNYLSSNSFLNIQNNLILNNVSINSVLTVSGTSNFNNTVSINSSINVCGYSIFNNDTTINSTLNVFGDTILVGNTTIVSPITISGYSIINNLTVNSSLNINSNSIFNDITINSNLNISGNSLFNNTVSINSSLNIAGNAIINSQMTINSNLNLLGSIIASLPHYFTNSAAKAGGIPIWGWYRTGGILKIRLDDTIPTVNLSGPSLINLYIGSQYTEPGAYTINGTYNVYFSLVTGSTNILSNILLSGTNTLITTTSILSVGNYTATYTATDNIGLVGLNYRLLNIIY
jgi:hypothetical protein